MSVEIERKSDDGLSRTVWKFTVADRHSEFEVWLSEYREQSRPSRRHGWQTTAHWPHVRSSLAHGDRCDRPDVTDSMREEVIAKVCKLIRFTNGPRG